MAGLFACLVALLVSYGVRVTDTTTLTPDGRAGVHPAADFSRHTLVKPKIYHGREKRQISSTNEENGEHVGHLQIMLEIDGENLILDLVANRQLIPKNFFYKHQENGKYKIHNPTAQEIHMCHYNGKVRNKPGSWVALSTCDGMSGVIFDGTEMHYIEKNLGSNLDDHFLYKHSDLAEHNKTCGYGDNENHTHHHTDNRILRYKRGTDQEPLVRGPYNANKESKYVELVLVVDNREFKELGESKTRVINHCKTMANIINGLYSPLNIFIALVGIVIWSEHDEISFSPNGDTTLTNFLHYRRMQLINEHPNDNAQLLTKFSFENGVVGKALKGPICTYEFSGGVNTDHSPVVGIVATTVAHEMGHNFGMEHDTNECKCPDDRCIMAASSSAVVPTHWSSCSLNYLLLAFTHGMDYCLKNKPESLFDSPVCGNGFVEPGEQCDCGLPEHCDNTCCNATTCMLHNNASCATGECCDLMTCKPKNTGTLCRSADYECDLPEYCTGQSEYCPPDIYKLDTEVCDGGRAFCYHGFCRTRTDQCKLLWGETGKSSDSQCYVMNTKGTRHGNCGYNKFDKMFYKCDNESVLCGMLHCKHLNEKLEFGMESVAILSHTFINKKGSIIPCRTAIVDLGINQMDPGLTPDGAKCGDGKMCVNQKCMSVASLRKQGPNCPTDCNGNGWCNNLGHCHCRDGFAPPYCDYPGHGGSEDSGPAADPKARQGIVAAMFIFFLGVVPLLAIISFLAYYAKHNCEFGWQKSPPAMSKSPSKSRGPGFPPETIKTTEDNHSLLHEDSPPPAGVANDFFGNFKGFSLTPMKKKGPEPIRSAPPPPTVPQTPDWRAPPVATVNAESYNKPAPTIPTVHTNTNATSRASFFNKPVQKLNSFRNNINNSSNTTSVPALPPPNPGSNMRPIISPPVLESSTSNAKELISPLRNVAKVPFRVAPDPPNTSGDNEPARPLSTPEINTNTVLNVNVAGDLKKPQKDKENSGGALNRIASFLKPAEKKPVVRTSSLPKSNQVKANKILDKHTLRNLEISEPIPQTQIDVAITVVPIDPATKKTVVMRAQSMRATKPTQRPNIQTFGSMRQTAGFKRPLSIPFGARPKSPPPPRPQVVPEQDTIPSLPGYQKPKPTVSIDQSQYDDCLNRRAPIAKIGEISSPLSTDNIYAVIEESPSSTVSPVKSSGSNETMGLLREIVSEIQNRNFDSIYSTSTLNRKKKEAEKNKKQDEKSDQASCETYVNMSPDSEYSNMSNIKSSASSTSSGYINPSKVNVPVKQLDKKKVEDSKPILSTFKSENKPSAVSTSSEKSNTSTTKSTNVSKPSASPTNKTPPKTTNLSRQVTPPNLRATKTSPSRLNSQNVRTNRSVTNSPDLITSCNGNTPSKGPDIVSNGTAKKPITSAKPNLNSLPKGPVKPNLKSASMRVPQDKKEVSKPTGAGKVTKTNSDVGIKSAASTGVRNAAKQSSNVASLQKKFESKS